MKRKTMKRIAFAFSFLLAMSPLQVSAARTDEAGITKELTLIVPGYDEAETQAEKQFPVQLKENGKLYERKEIEYMEQEINYLGKKEKTVEQKEEPKAVVTENGVEYTLKKSEKRERIVTEAAEQTVTAYDDYDYAVAAADVPATKTVTAVNNITGATEQVICNFTGISDAGTTTVENIMTITFSDYDAAYYEWNGNYIPKNEETPPLAGYEDSLLASAGAGPGSAITGYYWSGEPYTVDGVVYREAAATVQQQVQMYRANYSGQIVTPEKKETVYKAVYEAPDQNGEKQYTVKATATYTEVKKSYVPYIIAAGAGLAVIAGLAVLILVMLAKKKQEEEK